VNHLDAKQVKSAVNRLENIISKKVPIHEMLEEERWYRLSVFMEIYTGKVDSTLSDTINIASKMPGWVKNKQLRYFNTYIDQAIEITRKPYITRPPEPKVQEIPRWFACSSNQLNHYIFPSYYKFWFTS